MKITHMNGNQIKTEGISISTTSIAIENTIYSIPDHVQSSRISLISNKAYVGIYRFDLQTKRWKRSIRALWHNYLTLW